MYKRIAVVCDSSGYEITKHIPKKKIICIIGAFNRPKYHSFLKKEAKNNNIQFLIQPSYTSIEYKKFIADFTKLSVDLILSYSYSLLLKNDILKLVSYNAVNLHAAYLPRNRGPNPTQWAIIQKETYTGTTLHYMSNEFDTGDIISQKKLCIGINDTWKTIDEKLHRLSLNLFSENVGLILKGKAYRKKQNNNIATKTLRLTPEYPLLDFINMSLLEIFNLIRAQVKPLSGAYYFNKEKKINILEYKNLTQVFQLIEGQLPGKFTYNNLALRGVDDYTLKTIFNFYLYSNLFLFNSNFRPLDFKNLKDFISKRQKSNETLYFDIMDVLNEKKIGFCIVDEIDIFYKRVKVNLKFFSAQNDDYVKDAKSLISKFCNTELDVIYMEFLNEKN
jgi:UDP-4-amino-4-deoxy-L-arabinose formyltransferase/UDP-glucuronic acid dehydrogenase (UDP-4-keto-hexauronic acid decarboxylating)